jgi:aspartyl-tRNA(Asn)/glutamyl-tRNA(Gln) amidotransferase subunit A
MKPTYGYVSRYGLIPFASSLDQIGPVTQDVTDCALLLNVIGGHDPSDSTSADIAYTDLIKCLTGNIKGLKIGVAKEYFVDGIQAEVKERVLDAIKVLQECGAEIVEVSLPHSDYALAAYHLIAPAEASSNLARYDGVQYGYRSPESNDLLMMYTNSRGEGFGAEVKRRIMLGTYVLSSGYYDAYYLKAQKVRTLIKQDFDKAFELCDCIVSPTAPITAFGIGEKSSDLLSMYMADVCTIPANLAGIPALSIPCGYVDGLPVGLQIMGRHFEEKQLLNVAYAFEQSFDARGRKPHLEVVE